MVALLEFEVRQRVPVGVFGDQGGLRAGIYGEPFNLGSPMVYGEVGHQSVYGDVIALGRKPGGRMPPQGSLLRWIEVVLGADAKEAQRIEFVVRRKISQKGFEGAFMFDKAFSENEDRITKIAHEKGLYLGFTLGGTPWYRAD